MKKLFSAMLAIATIIPFSLLGQIQSARVEGNVIDSSSATIPAAKVTLVNTVHNRSWKPPQTAPVITFSRPWYPARTQ